MTRADIADTHVQPDDLAGKRNDDDDDDDDDVDETATAEQASDDQTQPEGKRIINHGK